MIQTPIIEVIDLLRIYRNPDVMIFDVSNCKEAKQQYEKEHLKGAAFIEMNEQLTTIDKDLSKGGRHPLPDLHVFSKTLSNLGITKNKNLVLYDVSNGSNAAARFWWMLRAVGHTQVQVLNGGFLQAKRNNFPMCSGIENYKSVSEVYPVENWILPTINIQEVENYLNHPNYLIVDVRNPERYKGSVEPIDLIAGHIPGAINIPFTENLDVNGMFLSPDSIRKKYESFLAIKQSENIVVHCGSGVTACHTILAFSYANMTIPTLYVGSWSEWSRNNKTIDRSNK
jgi:thiosulfate/3-mercaptopyruvate sulfurtransferase